MNSMTPQGFVPPPYPYDRLDRLRHHADRFSGGVIDLSIGTPFDPPAASVVAALATSGAERGYPPSIGSEALRSAAARWMDRRFAVDVPISAIAACVGSKEFVVTAPQWLRLRSPERDTVLFPAVAYPSYEMGATLAGCRAVPVPSTADGVMDLGAISADDTARALALWVNSPANPSGELDDLVAAAAWGRTHGVPVLSDECYAEFTWDGPARTILEHGLEGVIALHSLSKRSNLAGARVAFYAGDPELVHYLSEVRKHVGMMMPGPVQAAGVVALDDDAQVAEQRDRYRERLDAAARAISQWSEIDIARPAGGFYLWFRVGDAWEFAERLAIEGGCLVSPGEFYGEAARDHVRVAVVTSIERIDLLATRLSGAATGEMVASARTGRWWTSVGRAGSAGHRGAGRDGAYFGLRRAAPGVRGRWPRPSGGRVRFAPRGGSLGDPHRVLGGTWRRCRCHWIVRRGRAGGAEPSAGGVSSDR